LAKSSPLSKAAKSKVMSLAGRANLKPAPRPSRARINPPVVIARKVCEPRDRIGVALSVTSSERDTLAGLAARAVSK
jgi:hypothetical protein